MVIISGARSESETTRMLEEGGWFIKCYRTSFAERTDIMGGKVN